MKLLGQRLMTIAAAAIMGSAQAGANSYDLGALLPTTLTQAGFFAAGGSFVDIYHFTIGAEKTLAAGAVSYSPVGTGYVSVLAPYGGSDVTGPVRTAVLSSSGSRIEYLNLLAAGNLSFKVAGLADGHAGSGDHFSLAAVPEPSEWTMLFAGLVVVGFMARRKSSLVTG